MTKIYDMYIEVTYKKKIQVEADSNVECLNIARHQLEHDEFNKGGHLDTEEGYDRFINYEMISCNGRRFVDSGEL